MKYIYALGFFDGVHVGHRALIARVQQLCAGTEYAPGVVTFADHPDALVLGAAPLLINTGADRDRLIRECGIDHIVTLPFDRKMFTTAWDAFLDTLLRDYDAAGFVCGEDFRFGYKGLGNAGLLEQYCLQRGLPCAVVPDQLLDGIRVSSTAIRSLLEAGEMEKANRFLGHPHILTGCVVAGKQLGRTLGIPTANLTLPEGLAVPKFGVYACRALLPEGSCPAVTNIGVRPTVSGTGITVEPWLLDFSGDLYGKPVTLEFYTFLRPERRFDSLEELKQTVLRNAEQTREYFLKEQFTFENL